MNQIVDRATSGQLEEGTVGQIVNWATSKPTPAILLVGALLATAGWVWTGRLQRSLLRKQHTFNALLNASFTEDFQKAHNSVRPYLLEQKDPKLNSEIEQQLKNHFVFLLNHYEFLAAGIRNGDISERLLRDSERGSIINLVAACEEFIESTRNNRKRKSTFEHLDWLYDRWHEKPPHWAQRTLEWMLGRPLYYNWHFWCWVAGVAGVVITAFAVLVHL